MALASDDEDGVVLGDFELAREMAEVIEIAAILIISVGVILAIAAGALVLGERLEIQHLLGIVMIALGLALIDGRVVGNLKGRPRG